MRDVAIEALLGLGALTALFSCIAVVLVTDFYERMHYLAPPATVSAVCFTVAVWLDKGFSAPGIKAILITVILFLMSPVLSHATARAARVRGFEDKWSTATEARGPGEGSTAGANSRVEVEATIKD